MQPTQLLATRPAFDRLFPGVCGVFIMQGRRDVLLLWQVPLSKRGRRRLESGGYTRPRSKQKRARRR